MLFCSTTTTTTTIDTTTTTATTATAQVAPTIQYFQDGIVPYTFDPDCSQTEQDAVLAQMALIEDIACVTFVPRENNENPSVTFTKTGSSCSADVGATNDGIVNIGSACQVSL